MIEQWECEENSIRMEHITRLEHELGIKYPAAYIQCVLQYHAGRPIPSEFKTMTGKINSVARLLSFNDLDESYILNQMDYQADRLLKGFIPFASEVAGDLICFDFTRSETNPGIVMHISEMAPEVSDVSEEYWREVGIVKICDSFTEFLEGLFKQ